jgi:hypothetical protein
MANITKKVNLCKFLARKCKKTSQENADLTVSIVKNQINVQL